MKRTAALFLLALVGQPLLGIDTVFLEPVQPVSPAVKGMGGVTTTRGGLEALFANPAAFADPKIEFTLLSVESTAHVPLSGLNDLLDARRYWNKNPLTNSDSPLLGILNNLIGTTGLGQEFSIASGWVGGKLGLGFLVSERAMMRGANLLKTTGTFDLSYVGVIGMGWPFDVGLGTLNVGGSVRPMYRTLSDLAVLDLMTDLSSYQNSSFTSGFGLGMDLGLRWDVGDFRTGLAVRDASGTLMDLRQYSFTKWITAFSFPSGGTSKGSTIYRVPTVVAFGGSWEPKMGALSSLFQPSVAFDLQIPIKDENTQPSFWTWTHVGAEFLLLKSVALRAGFNQGYLTFGMGAKLFILDLNMAIFSDELGRFSGYQRRAGITFDLGLAL